jgi:uncharacterized membrane protein (UPF0127 family)
LPTVSLPRGALLACLVFAGLSASACAAPATGRACTAGQPEITPLQPLAVETRKGRFHFDVELAGSEDQRETGLMCRTALAPDHGMLFDFQEPRPGVAFWMRNTLIPLDIVFIRPDGRVLSIARNAKPLDESELPAGGTIRGVLELAGGRAAQIGLMPGDRVIHGIFAP